MGGEVLDPPRCRRIGVQCFQCGGDLTIPQRARPSGLRLLIEPGADQVYFNPRNAHRRPIPRDQQEQRRREGSLIVYADSIAPVLDRAVLWDDAYRIDGNLSLESAPGHTPGSAVVRLSSDSDRAVFVGDLLHSPVQILEPRYNSCFCEHPQQAAKTRRRVLERAADTGELIVPAHFAGVGAAEIRRDGGRLAVSRWAPLTS